MRWDEDTCYAALVSRDPRFDGQFFTGVLTTGIYCRPICPARTPHRRNVRFFASAAAAAAAGLRACRRCRPDTLPGSRHWDSPGDLVDRALVLIASGVADDRGVTGLAEQLHVTPRHLNRLLTEHVGATAGQLARTRRAQTGRLLLEQTGMPAQDVAFAAGFGSVRQFNDAIVAHFGATPTQLRATGNRSDTVSQGAAFPGRVSLRLGYRAPYARDQLLGWLRRHAVPGVDEVDVAAGTVRTTRLDGTVVTVAVASDGVRVTVELTDDGDLRTLPQHLAAIRRWLDLDANPAAIDADLLAADVPALTTAVRQVPGMRVLGALDPFRSLIATIVGQQVSVRGAATQNARLAAALGDDSRFPTPDALAAADPEDVATAVGIPRARGRTLVAVAALVASNQVALDPGGHPHHVVSTLAAVPGIGPWTLADVRMRILSDPDVWPAGDLILRRAVAPGGAFAGLDPASCAPWRSYLAHHVWIANASPPPKTIPPTPAPTTRSAR